MSKQIIYNHLDEDDLNKRIEAYQLKDGESIIDRYKDVLISVSWVAKMHCVREETIINLAKRGLLPFVKDKSKNNEFIFRLSDMIRVDIDKLRKMI